MSIPVVGRSPIVDRRRAYGGWIVDRRDATPTPLAIGPVKRRLGARWAAIVASMTVLAGALGGVQAMPTRYRATSVVSFMPRPSAMTSADTVQLLGKKYVVLATSATIMQTAGDAIHAAPDDLATDTTATLDAGTGNLEVAVTRSGRQQAVDAANALADALVRRSQYDDLVQAEATSPATASRAVSRPARALLRSAGAVAAVLVGVLAWTLVRGRSRLRAKGPGQPLVVEGAW